ncbi:helix-turn-helix domain-containing protein [Halohasta salina]|uniref:helix-turn-helix domain-containing protein n=1 Tax=Halohasta salina TaxID=2961621 RepID=UPI0020A39D28|nr:helix-turn-helix domain-containing protein [Halohasta salina]
MVDAIREYLGREMVCEGLLECMFGLTGLDREVFVLLTDHAEPLTVDEIAAGVGRERSTAYRSVQRLIDAGLVRKEQINYEQGGYCHVFRPTDPDEIADDMQRMLNDWYAQMGQLVDEFRTRYDTAEPVSADQ